MPINPNIALQVRQPEIESPLNALARVSQVKNAISHNKLADLTLGQKQREIEQESAFNALYRDSLNPDGTVNRTSLITKAAQGGFGSKIPSLQKGFLETDEAQGKVNKQNVELIDAKLKQSRAFLEGVSTPEQYIMWHEANHKDPVLGPALAARGVTAETARASIMQALNEPGGLEKLLNQSRLGIEKFTEMSRPKIETRNLGGTTETMAIDPFNGKVNVTNTVRNTQSPESVASNAIAIRGQNMAEARGREANNIARANSTAGKAPSGYRFKQDGSLEAIPGGPADSKSGDVKLTEDQGKATGWLVQAENAFDNMQKATSGEIDPKTRKPIGTPSAARPGFPDVVAAIPSMGIGGAIANTMRSADRQKFMQGASSLSESLLRAATGAGVNKDEAAQKIRELTPVFGDDDATIKQKMEAIPLYIDSLKVRAGPGARKAQGIAEAKKAPNIDDLLKKYGD